MADNIDNQPFGLCTNDAQFLKYFHSFIKDLRNLVISNIEYYQRGKSSVHACFYATFCILLERTQVLEPQVINIVPRLQEYDFSEDVQANGYRSFISIVNRCCVHLLQLCRHININKTSLLFRSTHYLKELEAYVEVLGQLMACLGYLQQLMLYSKDGELFLEDNESVGDDLLVEVEMLNTDCFYGRCLGFQFSESMQKVLQTVVIAMATYSECYEESSNMIRIASSLLNGSKYMLDNESRAKQVVDITRTEDIKFCKAFWSITESPLLHHVRSFTFPHVEVSEVLLLEPENFDLPMDSKHGINETVTITPPCAHTGPAPVKVRLISHAVREGMTVTRNKFQPKTGSKKPEVLPKSSGLLFHCHGGGFVAQSSQSHENYLRVWTKKLEMPILSVDYALAPELPFPRGLEESFYAYAWALKNCEKLGWTGERICFAGDSAGGNIVISTALRAVSYRIRVPDGILAAYIPSLVQYTPSPARLMAMIDPLLPVGILTRCLAAYAGIADKFSSALAKPIFCNPGKYETWEVIESDSCIEETESIPTNEKQEDKDNDSDSSNQNHCNKCKTESEAGNSLDLDKGQTNNDNNVKVINSPTSSDIPVCRSVENLSDDDFVVCELSNCEINENGSTNNQDSDNQPLGQLNSEDKEVGEANGSDTVIRESVKETQNDLEKSEDNNDELNEDLTNRSIVYNSKTNVDPEMAPDIDPTKMYAACKEILDEHDNVNDFYSEMDCTSCHSLENDDNDDNVELLSESNSICETLQDEMSVQLSQGKDLNHNIDGDCKKQLSVTDSDSGILHDCCVENYDSQKDIPLTLSSNKPTAELNAKCTDNSIVAINGTDEAINSTAEDQSKNRTDEAIDSTDDNCLKNKNQLSLDLPVCYHPAQKSDNVTSPKRKISPVSPQLSPGKRSFAPKLFSVQRKIAQSPIKLFRHLPIVKNMYMSPLLAPDDLLSDLPPVHLTACHFDPLLDDSVMFAKKLSKLGAPVTLKVFDNLPHGFLCFSDASVEARNASMFCIEKIQSVLCPVEKF
ncbi:hypothetical protein ACF0H5_011472 [Mactra antiquata]